MERRELFKLAAGAAAGATAVNSRAAMASVPQMQQNAGPEHILTEDGARLFTRDWGSGKPVLFLAGWTLPSDFWAYQMLALAQQGYRAVAYDRRGHGRSSDPGRGYSHDRLADDLAEIIRTLGLDGVTLVAHSMGGTEMARYFTRHGGRHIDRVVLIGTITPLLMKTADNPRGVDRAVLAGMRAPLSRDFPGWIAGNARPFFMPETSPDMIAWGKALMLQTSLLAAVELARANAETDFRRDLAQVGRPTLVIHGDKDASAPAHLTAEPTSRLIRGSRLVVYPGAPHGLPLTHIDRLNRDLLEFAAA